MNYIEIKAPRYSTKEVLVAKWKIGSINRIDIRAHRVDGSRRYPNYFTKSGEWIKQWPIEVMNGGFEYYAVPMQELMEDEDDRYNL